MNRHACRLIVILISSCALWPSSASAQTTQPTAAATQPASVSEPDPMKAIDAMRGELVDAFNKGDLDRLLSHLDDSVVVTWQNGEVCVGPAAVRAYYEKMMTGPDKRVEKLSASPVVDSRHIHNDWVVSCGNLHDEYQLTDGSSFKFDSRFTATVIRRNAEWKIASFHASVNAFDNPILAIVARKVAMWTGIIAGVIGVAVGYLLRAVMKRRRAPNA